MTYPPEVGITYLDLRAAIRVSQGTWIVKVWDVDDCAWRTHTRMYLTNGDVYQAQDTELYWLWWDDWIGPFDTEAAAVTALRMAF